MNTNTDNLSALRGLGDALLNRQTNDGALPTVSTKTNHDQEVVPYLGNYAACGLAVAFKTTQDPVYFAGVRRWMEWMDQRRNLNGTIYDYSGKPGAWVSTGNYGATDSYGSTYVELAQILTGMVLSETDRRWLKSRFPFARQSVEASLLTQQKNGLTTVYPTDPTIYLANNTEVLRGLLAGTRYFQTEVGRHRGLAVRCTTEAVRIAGAIATELWDAENESYYVGIRSDGTPLAASELANGAPMANLLAIGWLPRTTTFRRRARSLYQKCVTEFLESSTEGIPETVTSEGTAERLLRWGFAAEAQGDPVVLDRVRNLLRTSDPARFTNPAHLGHACRLLASAKAA